MDDPFKLDLHGYDEHYIRDVLDTFYEDAGKYGRRLIEIRMSGAMARKLQLDPGADPSYRGVPITVGPMDFPDTIEIAMAPVQ
ncbi:MAG TPA: hypothetical protein VFX06_14190 [Stellaceae bacterium]|nr:hypothetical protein [Stellaceae bacterium]